MSDKSKQNFENFKKGINSFFKGKRSQAFKGKANVLGSGNATNPQTPTPSSRPPNNPRNYPQSPTPKPTPTPKPNPTPSQPWNLEDINKNGTKKTEELAPMSEFNPYQASAISSTVLSSAANVPQNVPDAQNAANAPNATLNVPQNVQNVQEDEVSVHNWDTIEVALAMISSHENQSQQCFEIVGKLFRNIAGNQTEMKFRKLRLSNKKIAENIINVPGGVELLQGVGFQNYEENGDQFVLLPLEVSLEGMEGVLEFIENNLSNSNTNNNNSNINSNISNNNNIKENDDNQQQNKCDRNTKVFLPVSPDTDVPDWFFERTPADIKKEYFQAKKLREQNSQLMTREMREKLNLKSPQNNSQHTFAQIRIRFPEGVVLQGEFGLNEQCMNIYIFVEECLRCPGCTFELVLPNRQILDKNQTVKKADLVPQTLMNLKWSGQSAIDMKDTSGLKDELLQQASLAPQM